jgi:hypothetical protein
MVKRTVVVLGIFSLILLIAADASMAQMRRPWARPCFGEEFLFPPRPLYLPVDCPDPIQRTIVSTWECNIEGPCPPIGHGGAGTGCGPLLGVGRDDRRGLLTSFANAFGTPFDWFFGGSGGVYGCREMVERPCGSPIRGFVPRALLAATYFWYPTDASFFGGLW